MPYDGSGNFTRAYNWVADKLAAIKIQAARMDGEFDNYATALNQVLLRNGVAPLTGDLKLGANKVTGIAAGAVATPSLTFSGDATTGVYQPSAATIAAAISGVEQARFTSLGLSVGGITSIHGAFESAVIAAAALTGNVHLDYKTGALFINTANAVANFTFNVRGNGTTTLDSMMLVGQTLTLAVEAPQGATAYYCTAITVDSAAATVKWFGGAPTAGNVSGIDVYSITVIKTAAATFSVRASLAQVS